MTTRPSGPLRILFAGGGTGGHLYPALALAGRIQDNWDRAVIEFVGDKRGIEVREVPRYGFKLHKLSVGGFVGKSAGSMLRNLLRMIPAVMSSMGIVSRLAPDLVIGVGGYASFPTIVAAWILRRPRILLEQNSVPGWANRVLGKLVQRCYLSFEGSAGYFPGGRTRYVGNPVRPEAIEDHGERPDPNRFTVFLFGGSSGSRLLNNIIVEALPGLRAAIPTLRLIHQSGQGEYFRVKERYEQEGLLEQVELHSFIEEMGRVYRQSDICVCRGGATSVAELMAARQPAVLVPITRSAGDHQRLNARSLVEQGGAVLIEEKDLTAERLISTLADLAAHPAKLAAMRAHLEARPHPDAAKAILEDLADLLPDPIWKRGAIA